MCTEKTVASATNSGISSARWTCRLNPQPADGVMSFTLAIRVALATGCCWAQTYPRIAAKAIALSRPGARGRSVFQDPQTMQPVISELPRQKRDDRAVCFRSCRNMPEVTGAQQPHFFKPDVHHRRGFLFSVDAEAAEEARKPNHLKTGLLRTQHEIPIQRETKALVDRPDPIPDATPPEHRFLRDVADVIQRTGVVGREDRATDFPAVAIDENPLSVDDIDLGPASKDMCDISQRARQQRVVAVEIGHDVAIGGGKPEACVDGVG